MQLLEHNKLNRPIRDHHVHRISRQITAGRWRFNGDTIKIALDGAVLDGQHRLWAIIEAKTAVWTVIVYGVERDAFATIDTIRQTRTGGDTVYLNGATRYRTIVSTSLTWLIRWQRNCLLDYRDYRNKVENADIADALASHPQITRAVERANKLRRVAPVALLSFLYYVIGSRDFALADRLMNTLEDPSNVPIDDPFFRLRAYLTNDYHKKKDPLVTIAVTIKAANAARQGRRLKALSFRMSGKGAETFPTLEF